MIENWKQAYRMHSVQLAALVAFLAGLEPFIPQLAEFLPDGWASAAAGLIIVARLAKQNGLRRTTIEQILDDIAESKKRD